MLEWRKLEGEADIPEFIDAAVALYAPLLDRLAAGERPFFFDHWLRRFNHCDAWRRPEAGGGAALITIPRVGDRHEYRWQVRTLAVGAGQSGALALPPGVGVDRSFLMPCPGGVPATASVLGGMTATPVQLGYVTRIDDVTPAAHEAHDAHDAHDATDTWRFHVTARADAPAILTLLERAYPWVEDPAGAGAASAVARHLAAAPDLHRQREELRTFFDYGAGWCFHATAGDDAAPIAMASYFALPLPQLGTPAALTADLAVAPPHRGQGLARTLQRFASRHLAHAGIRWLHGNIDPDNVASRRQAEGMGRTLWREAVRFRPEGV